MIIKYVISQFTSKSIGMIEKCYIDVIDNDSYFETKLKLIVYLTISHLTQLVE